MDPELLFFFQQKNVHTFHAMDRYRGDVAGSFDASEKQTDVDAKWFHRHSYVIPRYIKDGDFERARFVNR